MAQEFPAEAFAATKQPSPLSQGAGQTFSAHVARKGLDGFNEILGAHIAAWHKTAQSLAGLWTQNVSLFLDGTPDEDKGPDLMARLDDARLGRTARSLATAYHRLRPDVPLSSATATHAAGLNAWSTQKQEVGQLFALAAQLDPAERERAFESLKTVAPLVAGEMGAMQAVENDLLSIIQDSETVSSIDKSRLKGNVIYHASVRDDWEVLGREAEEAARTGPVAAAFGEKAAPPPRHKTPPDAPPRPRTDGPQAPGG